MGLPVLILGESGTGKSASMRNFKSEELAVINVAGKPLPFKNKIPSETTDDYRKIRAHMRALVGQGCKSIAIDDAQYLMANEFMRRATERGFDKFTEIAQNFWTLVNDVKDLPDDVLVYFMAHIERDQDGNEKIKTIGKLLDEKITVEGMFTIVLKTNVTDGVYSFLTQNSGHDTVKSPIGMFPSIVIDNDLKYVDEKIRNYYELGDFLSDEKIAGIDEMAKREDMPIKEEKEGRKSRRVKEKKEEPAETPQEKEEEKPKRGRRKVSEDPERQAVENSNTEKVVNANLSEDGEPVPFEDAEIPEVEPVPKRKSRKKVESEEATNESEQINNSANEPAAEEKPARRRRRNA